MPMLPYPLYTLISLCFLLACSLTLSLTAHASDTSMIDLTKPNEYQLWRSTNDNVMGGISQGGVRYDGETSLFSGELSLENNGGFSSANRSIEIAPEMAEVELTSSATVAPIKCALLAGTMATELPISMSSLPRKVSSRQRHSSLRTSRRPSGEDPFTMLPLL